MLLSALNPTAAFTLSGPGVNFPAEGAARFCTRQAGAKPLVASRCTVSRASKKINMPLRSQAPCMLFGGSKDAGPLETLRAKIDRVSYFSWWAQLILSTVSGVLLIFANSVSLRAGTAVLAARSLAVGGLAFSLASTLWTWRYRRLAAKLGLEPETSVIVASKGILGIAKWGIVLNLVGMGLSLVGAEAIVGTLAAKALTQSQASTLGVLSSAVQPLDMLVVQANTNIVLAHFASLLAGLQLKGEALKSKELVLASAV